MANRRSWQGLRRTVVPASVLIGVSVLLLLPVACRQTRSNVSSIDVDSNSLQQTVVVATLDCPLPEHKNAIWCSTFQMAWDKLRQDIIGEPVQLLGAQELASRLNAAPFPAGAIDEKSYYAAAGFVKDGIIEQVQKEQKRRFPSEPVPTFDGRYRALPDPILAYAYLNVDVRFAHPYYVCMSAFDFRSSTGEKTGVTAFSTQTSGHPSTYEQVRYQVDVLYHRYGQGSESAEFAVDLSKQTQPYQVILARMPRYNTLGEAAQAMQARVAEFKNDPNYEVLRELRPIDRLIVPDVFYKLTHHFDDLLNKHFGNPRWSGYYIFEAMQKIDFTLSRTGVVLKSQARLAGAKKAGGLRSPSEKPRDLYFDGPFLICVRKRDADAPPFFIMWVDNAELMKRY